MKAKSLEDFSKSALIRFIKSNLAFGHQDWLTRLTRIELELKLEENRRKDSEVIDQLNALTSPTAGCDWSAYKQEYNGLHKKWDQLQAEWDSLMAKLYPKEEISVKTKGGESK